jgi:hypothetical protein
LSKQKTLIRKTTATPCTASCQQVGAVCGLLPLQICRTCFIGAGYCLN